MANNTFYVIPKNSDLKHYGVLGMKWGVRRYQNKDGSLTAAGKKKYYKDYTKVAKDQASSYDYIKKTISKKDVEKLAMYNQEFRNSLDEYDNRIEKLFPGVLEWAPINEEDLIEAVMITDKKYSNQYDKIRKESRQKAIEYSREYFTKEENQKMSDDDIQKTKQFSKIFYSIFYDDNEGLKNLKKQVKNDPRIKDLKKHSEKQTQLLNKISKEEEKIVNDLVGEMSYLPGDEVWRNRFNIGTSVSEYTRELLRDKEYQKYINSRIKSLN